MRQTQFSGRTMTILGNSEGGLARKATVTFNEAFSACEAQIVIAKQVGHDVVRIRSLRTGELREIRSATVSGVSCSVRDGNAFAQ
jgi:hypothetical protein